MGLDMSLSVRKILTDFSNEDGKNTNNFDAVLEAVGFDRTMMDTAMPYLTIEIPVMYWRKANMIHGWFVDHVQDGNDDCGNYVVSIETLKELLNVCSMVYADNSLAEDLLPINEGFFFGIREYNEWYFEHIQDTIKMLSGIITDPRFEGYYFYYSSSW